jgi:hypothetical protein
MVFFYSFHYKCLFIFFSGSSSAGCTSGTDFYGPQFQCSWWLWKEKIDYRNVFVHLFKNLFNWKYVKKNNKIKKQLKPKISLLSTKSSFKKHFENKNG